MEWYLGNEFLLKMTNGQMKFNWQFIKTYHAICCYYNDSFNEEVVLES